jgi:hypothetical protein
MENELTIGTRIEHYKYGEGIISKVDLASYEIFFERGGKMEFSKSNADIEVKEIAPAIDDDSSKISLTELEKVLHFFLEQSGALAEIVPLSDKWIGGTLLFKPQDEKLKGHEIPIETFFHKIVMVRDRLRVLEQNINAHPKLNDEERVNLQQYITRVYGSLTSFNILFKEKSNHFVGSSKQE